VLRIQSARNVELAMNLLVTFPLTGNCTPVRVFLGCPGAVARGWPNDQRFILALVLGGLITALQGKLNLALS